MSIQSFTHVAVIRDATASASSESLIPVLRLDARWTSHPRAESRLPNPSKDRPRNKMFSGISLLELARLTLLFVAAISTTLLVMPLRAQAQRDPSPLAVTTVEQIQALGSTIASGTRLHLSGVITYYDSAGATMFLQDATGGVFINTDRPYPVHGGDIVEVDGIPAGNFRVEVANDPEIRVLRHGGSPAPAAYSYQDLMAGHGESQLVTIHGTVRNSPNAPAGRLDLVTPEGDIQVHVRPSTTLRPETVLDASVEVVGVASRVFDTNKQLNGIALYVPDSSAIRIVQKPDGSAKHLPFKTIEDVYQSRHTSDSSHPVRVRGTITYYKKGDSAVIEDNGKSLFIETQETGNLAVGDVVDATGFASDSEYGPILRHASLIGTGSNHPIEPHPVSYDEASSGLYNDNLISISGVLVSQLHDTELNTLVLKANGHLVSAYLDPNASMDDFQVGSRLQVSGICRIAPVGAWHSVHLSNIEMRSAADARLISRPSWFNVEHLLQLLVVIIVVAIATGIRAIFLKWRVVDQTAWIDRSSIIARERSRILEMISSNQSLEVLLREICKSTTELLPGANCAFSFQLEDECVTTNVGDQSTAVHKKKSFEVALRNDVDQIIGNIVVSSPKNLAPAGDSEQIYAVVSELASLAMRQSLMYRGLVFHSTHDPLTELPNRRLFETRLASALKDAEASGGQLAIIYIDINRFKHVNDQHGHKTGDLYLKQISARLRNQLRPVDTLARVGGDEFVVIAPFPEGIDRVYSLTARLKTCFKDPFSLDGVTIEGSASFGFARYPEHGQTADELTRIADHGMYISKNEAQLSESAHGLAIITPDELELALLHGRYRLAYQPQFSVTGRMTGLEALLRLDDPVLGLITPDAFISVAERHPVIVDIGAWTLRTALADAARWNLNQGDPVSIAVNVSVRQLEEPGYAKSVLTCLEEYAFPPERLEVELIERSLMFSGEKVLPQLEKLREAGVRIALDDFGTEESCLSLLHKLPIDTIKLDRSFIRAMDDEPAVLPIIRAIVSMAHSLGKRVIAEAIEHAGSVPSLMDMGKMDYQGYLLSRPITAQEVNLVIKTWRSGIVMPEVFRSAPQPNSKRLV
jgi:diguanylate cyclase (GGDEF)-like protein